MKTKRKIPNDSADTIHICDPEVIKDCCSSIEEQRESFENQKYFKEVI